MQIGDPDIWIWSVTWHDGIAYGVGYPTTSDADCSLYRSTNGRDWEILIPAFHHGNEAAIAFKPDGTAVCYLRGSMVIGQAKAPYTHWTWQPTIEVGGPDLIQLPDKRFILGGREGDWGTMKLFEIDPDTGITTHLISLPARGDSSYPGLVYFDNLLWCSYYSSSDDATATDKYLVPTEIRLAKIRLAKSA